MGGELCPRRSSAAAAGVVTAAAAKVVSAAAAGRAAALTVVDGRGDKKTKRGKVYAGSNGVSRSKPKKSDDPVDPYFSIREWGKAQDPPMSVEEVVAAKVAENTKHTLTLEEMMDSVTPF